MKSRLFVKIIAPLATIAAIAVIGMFSGPARVHAADDSDQARITQGLAIAPVPLNLTGRDMALVGLGSYLMNAVSDCNSCHNSGQPPNFDFAPGANPYLLLPGSNLPQPKKLNPATYLGGGQPFGTADGGPETPDNPVIVSRNLTPDKTGRPEGGHTLAEFMQIIRTGVDLDHVHPNLPSGVNGKVLQVMPWPTYQSMNDHELAAIYEYLSAIPCLEGGPGEPPNRCGSNAKPTTASAGPKNATFITREAMLDGTASTSADGKPLTYLWSIPQGSPPAAILHGTTATPTVLFGVTRGTYMFQLTVTDSTGKSATDVVAINFQGN